MGYEVIPVDITKYVMSAKEIEEGLKAALSE